MNQPSGEPGSGPGETGALGDRYRGALLGLAVGNALGVPVEGWPDSLIREHYPAGVREIEPGEKCRSWDDDLAQAVILAEAIIEHDTFRVEDLAERLVQWMRTNGRGIGGLTRAVLDELRRGARPEDAARIVWERHGGSPAGNGAVMRCAPPAMRWARNRERLLEETRTSAVVTHYDPRCRWSACAVNLAIAEALDGRVASIRDLAGHLERAGVDSQTLAAMREVPGRDLAHLDLCGSAMGFTLKAMQVGLWCLEHAEDFEASLVAVVNAGGDTDTNAAVAGAVLGALRGASAIPQRWVEGIARADHLADLADRLMERASGGPGERQAGSPSHLRLAEDESPGWPERGLTG